MGVSILNATFGDTLARRDVTESIKAKAQGGTIDVTANEDLIPAFEVSQETKLSNSDLADINKKAQEQCQGGADTACVRSTKARLMQEKHTELAQKDTSAANTIVGRSLQVVYRDEKGAVKRVVVPDGQKFKLENASFTTKGGQVESPSLWGPIQKSFSNAIGITVWTLVFVFSVAAAYRVFKIYGNIVLAIFIATLAVLLPLGGYSPQTGVYLIILIYGALEMGKLSRQKAAQAAALPPAPAAMGADPLAAIQGATGSVDSMLGSLKGANPMAAIQGATGSVNSLLGSLQGARANPMAALGSFLGKR